ncbi:MAG TPA: Holliday junction branch migration protein RuvA [Anaerolineales bacterium]|nr:Holliday junction branch migration protein RuvA [Anaerolineales bacterium]
MISTLRGILQHQAPGEITVDVAGVGLSVHVPSSLASELPPVGEVISLYTHLIVREDLLALYGFASPEQREVFELLLQVNGVGPKLALAILSHLSPDVLRAAVGSGQAEALDRVPGVGRKTAERIVFHLKDRLTAPEGAILAPLAADTEVLAALSSLGYNLVEAQSAVQALPPDAPEDLEARLLAALKYFSRP